MAIGVAFGLVTGVMRLQFEVHLSYILVPAYVVTIFLTLCTTEAVTSVAWDAAGTANFLRLLSV